VIVKHDVKFTVNLPKGRSWLFVRTSFYHSLSAAVQHSCRRRQRFLAWSMWNRESIAA